MLKAHLRKAAERTVDGLWGAIGRIIDTFTLAGALVFPERIAAFARLELPRLRLMSF
jgi:hypothetical protein